MGMGLGVGNWGGAGGEEGHKEQGHL